MLARAEIRTMWDLLLTLPRRYEDRRKFFSWAEMTAAAGTNESVLGRAVIERYVPKMMGPRGRRWLEALVRFEDPSTPRMVFTWFHDPGQMTEKRFPAGSSVIFRGKVQDYRGTLQIVHPELQNAEAELPWWEFGGWVPVYSEVSGLSTRVLRKIVAGALERDEVKRIPEALPTSLLARKGLPTFAQSLREVHFPKTWEPEAREARPSGPFFRRIAFEELFMMSLALHMRRAASRAAQAKELHRLAKIETPPGAFDGWLKALPFQLTGDQSRTVREVYEDLALQNGPVAMHRLVQGDVGSGKTVIAFLAALAAVDAGYQVVMMAPTEILADQHFTNFCRLFPEYAGRAALLKGSLTGANKKRVRADLAEGRVRFAIGTQALLTDTTGFENLGLVIVDEQHRFGVEQRLAIARHAGRWIPHLLVMTATPIPRSLALTYYGDLAMSVVKEKPPGRTPIQTHVVRQKQMPALKKRLQAFLAEGRQIYIVYPLVEESEELDLKDVKNAFAEWTIEFSGTKVDWLHGRMKSAEKDDVMRRFKTGETRVLVSTTVIEVGVDVPNASVIVIEHAERFGLSQLHQLRGRVGRGSTESFCVLVGPNNPGPGVGERLRALESTDDGFRIAELDLELRGPGEFLGRRQSGSLGFRVADLIRDASLMEDAREEARRILAADPTLAAKENEPLRRLVTHWWRGRMELTLSG